jgi:hypothetical protein
MVLFRQEGPADEMSTGIPNVDCDTRLMRTSAFRLSAWVSYPKDTGKYVKSRKMTVGGAIEFAAQRANDLGPRVLETGEEAWIKIQMASREKPVRGMIRGLARRYGVDAGTAIGVAQCESGMNPHSFSGRYAGVYQHDIGMWDRRAAHYGHRGDSPFDAYANIDVTMRMVRLQGWRAWGCA